ncbi:hypothetical protein [Deinococcus sp. Leaf326]|uniref:hypothetical protein n=1 Tax=Deinococcus sp. Leaf326 TaxID=1736338 RepID=UPI0006F8CF7C|nr:hypothetical protein [Deinococcus sp. Leaf326]KQR22905.1 hypothetical protein ASF71_06980 [Deinococcus sp. Leaf326]
MIPVVTEAEVAQVRRLVGRGHTTPSAARKLGVGVNRVERIRTLHITLPTDLYLLTDLAHELGISDTVLRRHAESGTLPARRWGKRMVYNRQQAAAVRAYYAGHAPSGSGWLVLEQAARELNCTPKFLHRVLKRVERDYDITVRMRRARDRPGRAWLYNPDDIRRAAAALPRQFRAHPRGYVGSKQLADMVGRPSTTGPVMWIKKGCPHLRGKHDVLWFRPADVLTWLEGQPQHWQNTQSMNALRATLGMDCEAQAAD